MIWLNDQRGDPIVSLHHLKQPAAEVGPFKVLHDQQAAAPGSVARHLVLLPGSPEVAQRSMRHAP
jgi:hypothetical protein